MHVTKCTEYLSEWVQAEQSFIHVKIGCAPQCSARLFQVPHLIVLFSKAKKLYALILAFFQIASYLDMSSKASDNISEIKDVRVLAIKVYS